MPYYDFYCNLLKIMILARLQCKTAIVKKKEKGIETKIKPSLGSFKKYSIKQRSYSVVAMQFYCWP